MGSVKDLKVIKKIEHSEQGEGIFTFSDRYSVFDWGKMPNDIPGKGAALCMMSAFNFEMLERNGIPTHYMGVLDSSGKLVNTTDLTEPSNQMMVKLSRVKKPEFKDEGYNYTYFVDNRGNINNFVVPLEVIYRRGSPKGSSLFRTISKLEAESNAGELKRLLEKYGLKEKPKPGDLFPITGFDFTTKFESTDRNLDDMNAYMISGLSSGDFKEMEELRNKVVNLISGRAGEVGFIDYDGKHEYAFFNKVLLVDVVGTFDENRFMFNEEQVSKEFLRQFYQKNNGIWFDACVKAKEEAKEGGVEDWKSLVKIKPMVLNGSLVGLIGEMYMSGSDRYTGLNLFKKKSLEEVMDDLRPYRD